MTHVSLGYLRLLAEKSPTIEDRDHFNAAADEIEWLRVEVDDLKRININLRYLIPDSVWMDEVDRMRDGGQSEHPADEIKRLRALIIAWADAEDSHRQGCVALGCVICFRDLSHGPESYGQASDALRKAVGR